jgi:hypothetical protein
LLQKKRLKSPKKTKARKTKPQIKKRKDNGAREERE